MSRSNSIELRTVGDFNNKPLMRVPGWSNESITERTLFPSEMDMIDKAPSINAGESASARKLCDRRTFRVGLTWARLRTQRCGNRDYAGGGGVRDDDARELVVSEFTPVKGSKAGELAAKYDAVLGYTPEG